MVTTTSGGGARNVGRTSETWFQLRVWTGAFATYEAAVAGGAGTVYVSTDTPIVSAIPQQTSSSSCSSNSLGRFFQCADTVEPQPRSPCSRAEHDRNGRTGPARSALHSPSEISVVIVFSSSRPFGRLFLSTRRHAVATSPPARPAGAGTLSRGLGYRTARRRAWAVGAWASAVVTWAAMAGAVRPYGRAVPRRWWRAR